MGPQRLYTVPELAEETHRPYWYWDREIREGRLQAMQAVNGGLRVVEESAYAAWREAAYAQADAIVEVEPETSATLRASEFVFKP